MPADEIAALPQPRLRATLLALVVALLVPVVPFALLGEIPGERWVTAHDESGAAFGALAGSLLVADVLVPVPSSVLGVLLGGRLGLAAGFAVCFGGLLAGHAAGFGLGRAALARLDPVLPTHNAGLVVLASRPVPVLAEAVAIAAGASRMPFRRFLAAAAAGDAAFAGVLCAVGASLLPLGWLWPGVAAGLLLAAVAALAWRAAAGAAFGVTPPAGGSGTTGRN